MSRIAKVVAKVREIHRELGISDWREATASNVIDVCGVLCLRILEALYDFHGFIHTPLFMSDQEHNARLCLQVLENIIPGLTLEHIDPEKIASGDEDACLNILEITCAVSEAVIRTRKQEDDGKNQEIQRLLCQQGTLSGENREVDGYEARALSEIEDLEEVREKLRGAGDYQRAGTTVDVAAGVSPRSDLTASFPRRAVKKSSKSNRKSKPKKPKSYNDYKASRKLELRTQAKKVVRQLQNIRAKMRGDAKTVSKRLASAKKRLIGNSEHEVLAMKAAVNSIQAKFKPSDMRLYRRVARSMETALKANGHFEKSFSSRMMQELEKKYHTRHQWEDKAIRELFRSAIEGQQKATRDYRKMFKEEVTRLMDRELLIKQAMMKYLKDQQGLLEERLTRRTNDTQLRVKALAEERRRREHSRKQKRIEEMNKLLSDWKQNEERYKFEVSRLTPRKVF
ncbi:hypothetical protein AAMO2058_001225000 [Amorphochlora amoebiformis]